jgi:hypothetical protein
MNLVGEAPPVAPARAMIAGIRKLAVIRKIPARIGDTQWHGVADQSVADEHGHTRQRASAEHADALRFVPAAMGDQ